MKKLLLIACLLVSAIADAQSLRGYMRAGDECMRKADPLTAIGHYKKGLAYDASGELSYKLGRAYLETGEYEQALRWELDALSKASNNDDWKNDCLILTGDLLKRTKKFPEGNRTVSQLQLKTKADSLNFTDWKAGIDAAAVVDADTARHRVNLIGTEVNSPFSDFAPSLLNDTTLLYTSTRAATKGSGKAKVGAFYTATFKDSTFEVSVKSTAAFNSNGKNVANATVSPDHRIVVFSVCETDENDELRCDLYESTLKNGQWQLPVNLKTVNLPTCTSTQPCITTNKSQGYTLWFASNRTGGSGGMDIWKSQRSANGVYSAPENAGSAVNTRWNEITPYYDAEGDTLYYSSDRPSSLGGYDIFAISQRDGISTTFQPAPPVNSAFNDLYYYRSTTKARTTFLVSNRPPSQSLYGDACCYDIWQLFDLKQERKVVVDTTPQLVQADTVPKTGDIFSHLLTQPADQVVAYSRQQLPLKLYFDNDYPDPRTRNKTTRFAFDVLSINYVNRQSTYTAAWEKEQGGVTEQQALTAFFRDSVQMNNRKLEQFSEGLAALLASGYTVNLDVRGCASPLATGDYNLLLSGRRISSLVNYWKQWKDGEIRRYIDAGKLMLHELPAGESLASSKVSDRLNDKARSVYSVEAALERRIEVIELTISK